MSRYAQHTTVDVSRSRVELERVLMRYGCGQFVSGSDADGRAMIGFSTQGRQVRIALAAPDPKDFATTPAGRKRRPGAMAVCMTDEVRRRWRALILVLKAKFEAVESGISTFDDEFMAHIALPNGSTVGQFMRPQIEQSYAKNRMPALLPEHTP